MGKYLGVEIQVKGWNLTEPCESKMITIATKYAHTIMGVTRTGLERALVAYKLWGCCAIPAVLYCAKASVISQACVQKMDSIQIRSHGFFFSFQDLLPGCVAMWMLG